LAQFWRTSKKPPQCLSVFLAQKSWC
jgi:hypothetical protein